MVRVHDRPCAASDWPAPFHFLRSSSLNASAEATRSTRSGRATRLEILERLPESWSFAGRRVLDFGCGAGRTLRHFVTEAEVGEFHGCDIDGPSIDVAHREPEPAAPRVPERGSSAATARGRLLRPGLGHLGLHASHRSVGEPGSSSCIASSEKAASCSRPSTVPTGRRSGRRFRMTSGLGDTRDNGRRTGSE